MRTGLALAMAITLAVPAAVGAQTTIRPSPEQRTRQDKISIMEGTLAASVGVAARQVAKGVRSVDSNASLMFGTARAKGFLLEGYGVFFYVEIPTLDLSVMLTLEQIERSLQQRAEQQQPRADRNGHRRRREPRAGGCPRPRNRWPTSPPRARSTAPRSDWPSSTRCSTAARTSSWGRTSG